MNQLERLQAKTAKVAVLGLNSEGLKYINLGCNKFDTVAYDHNSALISTSVVSILDRMVAQRENLHITSDSSDLRACGVFILNGLSGANIDWNEVKTYARVLASNMPVGSWIVFGAHIEPDLAEVVLIPLIEQISGLKLGSGFEVSFMPDKVKDYNLSNLGNQIKMSHNLIVDSVNKVLCGAKSSLAHRISYQSYTQELRWLEDRIKSSWVPMLNRMSSETFSEFLDQTVNDNFLDIYEHLKLSNERTVDYVRFLELALKNGLKHELELPSSSRKSS